MDVFDLQAIIRLDSSKFESGLKSAIAGAKNLGSVFKKSIVGMADMAIKSLEGVSAALTAVGGYAVSVGKKFESGMSQVIATMGITKDTVKDGVNQYEMLEKAAKDAGENTVFSASQAADALNYLALAGYDAKKSAEALPSVLNLAQAGGLDLAYASDLATDAMAALGIEANKANLDEFGDKLAKTASRSNTSVSQLGEAILTVGGTAKGLSGGTTELNAVLGVLANRGIKGSEAGTQLRNIIMALSAPGKKATDQLNALGVAAYDDTGKMRPLNEVFEDFNSALADATDQERKQALSNIFNARDLKSAEALLAGVGEEFDNLSDEIEKSNGAMGDMAKTMTDNLEGAMKSLGSKAEAFGITLYESLNNPLKNIVNTAGDSVKELNTALSEFGFEGFARHLETVIPDIIASITKYVPKFAEIVVSITESVIGGFGRSLRRITTTIGDVGEIIIDGIGEVISLAVKNIANRSGYIAQTVFKLIEQVAKELPLVLQSVASSVTQALGQVIDSLTSESSGLESAFKSLAVKLPLVIFELLGNVISSLPDILSEIIPIVTGTLTTLAGTIGRSLPKITEIITGSLKNIITSDNISSILDAGFTIVNALLDGIIGAIPILIAVVPTLIGNILTALVGAIPKLFDIIPKLTEAIPTIIESILQAIVALLPQLFEAGQNLLENILNGLITAVPKILEMVPKILESLLAAIQDIIPSLLDGIIGLLEVFTTLWPELLAVLIESLGTVLPQVIDLGVQILEALISGLWDNMPSLVSSLWSILKATIPKVLELYPLLFDAVKKILTAVVNAITEYFPFIWDTFTTVISQIWDFISPYLSKIWDSIKEWFSNVWNGLIEWLGEVWDGITTWFSEAPGKIWGFLVAVVEKVGEWRENMKEKAKEAVLAFIEAAIQFINDLPSKIGDILGNVIGTVATWIIEFKQKAQEAVVGFIKTAIEFFQNLPSKIGEFLGSAVAKVIEWRDSLKEKAIDAITNFIAAVIEFIQELPGKILDFLSAAAEKVTEWRESLKEKAKEAVSGFIEKVVEFIQTVPAKIEEFLISAAEKVLEWREKLKEKAEKAIKGLIEKVTETIDELPKKMVEKGREIVEGLWDGITGAKEWLGKKIGEFANGFVGGFSESFEIHSPSRLMRDKVGKYIAQGIGVGFTDEMSNVERTSTEAAINAFNSIGKYTKGLLSSTSSTPLQRNSGAIGGIVTTVETINIYVEGMQIASDYDVDRMTDRAIERLRDRLKMADVYDRRGIGGTGW